MVRCAPLRYRLLVTALVSYGALGLLLTGCQTTHWSGPALAKPMTPGPMTLSFSEIDPSSSAAENSYATARQLEAECDPRCIDSYFEAAKASWYEMHCATHCETGDSDRACQIYHSSVAQLVCAGTRFGRLDPLRGLKIQNSAGSRYIAVNYHEFVWQPEDFNGFVLVGTYCSDQLPTVYRESGIGVPLLVKRKRTFDEPLRKRQQMFSATAVLQPSAAAGTDSTFSLDFYDPLRVKQIAVDEKVLALRRDLSAPFAYRLYTKGSVGFEAFRSPSSTANAAGLVALEPYQPGKIPLVFIHGLLSDPTTWITMANELRAKPEIQERYQIWAFEYHTGEPFVRSAQSLRKDLAEAIERLDPHRQDPALANMVLVGHSMGGLVAKLQVTSSGTQLWDSIANRPLDELVVSDKTRTNLAQMLFFEPQPAIGRVIFIGTPHRGSAAAQRLVGRMASALVRAPQDRKVEHEVLMANNPGVFTREVRRRIPTSIDMLEPKSCLLQAVEKLPIAPDVALHSIIGDRGNLVGEPSDGVVAVRSARHAGVLSEHTVWAKHTEIQKKPAAMDVVMEILRTHAEADGVPAVGFEVDIDDGEFELAESVLNPLDDA